MSPRALRIDGAAFDLDGTLIDTAPDIGAALNSAFAAQGLPALGASQTRGWIGDGPDRLIERALEHQRVVATPALRAALRSAFDAATLSAPLERGAVFAGIESLLARWHPVLPMAVVTNKPTVLARQVLGAAGLLRYFKGVHGADRPDQRKPAPALLQAAAVGLGVAPARLMMVGDSVNDLRCAEAAGCPAAWVAWGYGAFAEGGPAWRIESPAALAACVESN